MRFATMGDEHGVKLVRYGRVPLELLILSLLALFVSAVTSLNRIPVAHAAHCATSSTHCYAEVQWSNYIHGSSSTFQTVGLYSALNTYDHISDEMWLVDQDHSCLDGGGASWLEIGEATWINHTGNWYFWAKCPPGQHFLATFINQPPGGDVNQYFTYTIEASDDYNWYLSRNQNGIGIWQLNVQFSMTPYWQQVGLETTDNSYSITHSNPDNFIYNQWYGTNNQWGYQHPNGSTVANNPPYWSWIVPPSQSNTGGQGQTTCC